MELTVRLQWKNNTIPWTRLDHPTYCDLCTLVVCHWDLFIHTFKFIDEEGDLVSISSDNELQETMNSSLELGMKELTLIVTEEDDLDSLISQPAAEFVEHQTIPDRTVVKRNQTLVKKWIVRNSGDVSWDQESRLVFYSGDSELKLCSDVFVGSVDPGRQCVISITTKAPDKSGRYTAFYKLLYGSGNGLCLWLDIVVRDDSMEKPSPRSDQKKYGKYADSMNFLLDLGFTDESVNLFLLEKHKNNLRAVCNFLLGQYGI